MKMNYAIFFFFSSRRRHTRFDCDWSSDVCSSDLWLLSTHQGSVEEAHLQSYLDEFVFRFNRRRARSRGLVFYRLLQLAAGHDPVRYRNIVAGKRPRKIPPAPPAGRGHPPSLERPSAERPWRAADPGHPG